jgi:dTDP-4-amino-4,6-dideoxygalactose transaminase
MRIPFSKPEIGEKEIDYVTRALRSGRLSLGPLLQEFEDRFAEFVGARYAIATNSGTSALHLCVKALGIGAGDEILTTSFSFVASTNCLLYERAHPAFADVDPETLNIDPAGIRKILLHDYAREGLSCRLVSRHSGRVLKAILPVHVFGLPCSMEPILETAREFNLQIVEDACEALGAEYHGRRVGTFGDAAVFAFYPNKQVTTAEGGMIVTNNTHIAQYCRSVRNQGRVEQAGWLVHAHLGYNYRLSELHCALGLAQLERIDELLAMRDRVAAMYSEGLAGIKQIDLPRTYGDIKQSWFAYVIRVRGAAVAVRRDGLMAGLLDRGIDCRPYFPAIHRQPYFRDVHLVPDRALPHADLAAGRCLALPFFPSMSADQVSSVCSAIRGILSEMNAPADSVKISAAEVARAAR